MGPAGLERVPILSFDMSTLCGPSFDSLFLFAVQRIGRHGSQNKVSMHHGSLVAEVAIMITFVFAPHTVMGPQNDSNRTSLGKLKLEISTDVARGENLY